MARRLALVLLFVSLAVPATAEAAEKTLKVPVPRDGDVSFALYNLRAAGTPKPGILGSRGLGDTRVIAAVGRNRGRLHEAFVFVMNPDGGAGASQARQVRIRLTAPGSLAASAGPAARNFFTGDGLSVAKATAVSAACTRMSALQLARGGGARASQTRRTLARRLNAIARRARAERSLESLREYLCQNGTTATTVGAQQELQAGGVLAPGCSGFAEFLQAGGMQLRFQIICVEPVDVLGFLAQQGNPATSCTTPQGSFCSAGAQCGVPHGVCYLFPTGGTPPAERLVLDAGFSQPVRRYNTGASHGPFPYVEPTSVGPGPGGAPTQHPVWLIGK